MDSKSKTRMDIYDLSQECLSYFKIKQFLADRISEQQIINDQLRQKLKYYIIRDIENKEIITRLSAKVDELEKKDKSFSILTPEDAISENLGDISKEDKKETPKTHILLMENEIEELKDNVNKLTVDKFVFFNELNELVQLLKKLDLEKVGNLYGNNDSYTREQMPCVLGLKFNILSAESQIGQIGKVDQMRNKNGISKEDIEFYIKLIDEGDKEFNDMLNKKLYLDKDGNLLCQ